MLSNHREPNHDVIPGQLKTVVVNQYIAISFSGNVGQALHYIRKSRYEIIKRTPLKNVISNLSKITSELGGAVDFIVASHFPNPTLYKIANGKVFHGSDRYWLGNAEAATLVQEEIYRDKSDYETLPGYATIEEDKLAYAFKKIIYQKSLPDIGGFAFYALGSPYGYCYLPFSNAYAWDVIKLDDTFNENERRAYEKTGTTYYTYETIGSRERGVGVGGAYLSQNNIGFIY